MFQHVTQKVTFNLHGGFTEHLAMQAARLFTSVK